MLVEVQQKRTDHFRVTLAILAAEVCTSKSTISLTEADVRLSVAQADHKAQVRSSRLTLGA
jgi:hypothetical protein